MDEMGVNQRAELSELLEASPSATASSSSSSSSTIICLLDLPDVLLHNCLVFVGPGHYRFVASTCHRFHDERIFHTFPKTTTWKSAAGSVSCAKLCLDDHETTEITTSSSSSSTTTTAESPLRDAIMKKLTLAAASVGSVNVLQWALEEQRSSSDTTDTATATTAATVIGYQCFVNAGAHGQVKVLQWGEDKGLDWYSRGVSDMAARYGHVDVLDWIHQRRSVECCSSAAEGGHIPVLIWMKDHGLVKVDSRHIWYRAAVKGHLHVLEWLIDNGFTMIQSTVEGGAVGGHIDVLLWALDHNLVVFTPTTCVLAACYGHLDVLKWLRAHDCPWDSRTIEETRDRHPAIAQWAIENGCPEPA